MISSRFLLEGKHPPAIRHKAGGLAMKQSEMVVRRNSGDARRRSPDGAEAKSGTAV
jgi:hypothetical protein